VVLNVKMAIIRPLAVAEVDIACEFF
jgi:hypothetical protein